MRPSPLRSGDAGTRPGLALPALAVAALLVLLFLPALRGEGFIAWPFVENNLLPFAEGKTPDGRFGLLVDSAVQWHPFDRHMNESLTRGILPARDPWNRFGNPSVAPSWGSVLYPPKLLLHLLLPPLPAHNLLVALHLFLAGLGMALFVRGLGGSVAGMTLAAISWTLAGPVVVWAELQFGAIAAAHCPFLAHLASTAFTRRSLARAAAGGVLLGHLLLGCHLQFALYGALLTLPFLAWGAYASGAPARFSLAACAALLAVAPLVAAPTLIPAFELAADSERAPLGWFEDYTFARPFHRLLLLPAFQNPALFGDPDGSSSFHSHFATNANDFQGFAGTAAFGLGLAALAGRIGPAPLRFVAAFALAAAFLPPAHAPIYYLAPGGSRMCASRILFLFAFALAALAGVALDRAARPPRTADGRRARGALAFALAAGVLLPASAVVATRLFEPALRERLAQAAAARPDPDGRLAAKAAAVADFYLAPSPRLLLHGAAAGVLALALFGPLARHARILVPATAAVEMLLFAGGLLPHAPAERIYPPHPLLSYLRPLAVDHRVALDLHGGRLMSDTLKPYGIHDLGGKGPLYPGEVGRLLAELSGGPVGSHAGLTDFRHPLLPRTGVGFVLSPRDAPPGFPERLERVWDAPSGETRLFRVPGASPLVRLVPGVRRVADPAEAFAVMADPAFDPRREACAEGAVALPPAPDPAAPPPLLSADLSDPRRIDIRVDSVAGGFLVALFHAPPGTRAEIDGLPTPLSRADGIFLGCAVPPGTRLVSFAFPAPLRAAPLTACVAGLLLAAALALPRGAARLAAPPQPDV